MGGVKKALGRCEEVLGEVWESVEEVWRSVFGNVGGGVEGCGEALVINLKL